MKARLQISSETQVLSETMNKESLPLHETHWLSAVITLNAAWHCSAVKQVLLAV